MTAHALVKWVAAWDSIEALREGIDEVLDSAAANPHLCGLKQGRVRFEMEPTYMLGFKDGSPIFALLATNSAPYFDCKRPIRERVAVLLNRHPADAAKVLQSSDDFYPHERSRAAELLEGLSRERAEAAARKAERDARASLVAGETADVVYRLATLEAQPLVGGLDDLPEYIEGLEYCPTAGGKELIANSLFKQTKYYNQWYRFDGFAAAFMSALADVDGPGAEKLRDALVNRFGDEVGTERDEELALLLGRDC